MIVRSGQLIVLQELNEKFTGVGCDFFVLVKSSWIVWADDDESSWGVEWQHFMLPERFSCSERR